MNSELRRRIPWSLRSSSASAAEEIPLIESTSSSVLEGAVAEETAFGAFVTAEEAGLALDATGVGAPIGITVGVLAAAGFGAYEIYEHLIKSKPKVTLQKVEREYNKAKANPEPHIKEYQSRLQKYKDNNPFVEPLEHQYKDFDFESLEDQQPLESYYITLPNSKYIGPGNPINLGEPINRIDAAAKLHDIVYTEATGDDQIREADNNFKNFAGNTIAESLRPGGDPIEGIQASVGYIGIAAKNYLEDTLNSGKSIYPSFSGKNKMIRTARSPRPPIDKDKLTDKPGAPPPKKARTDIESGEPVANKPKTGGRRRLRKKINTPKSAQPSSNTENTDSQVEPPAEPADVEIEDLEEENQPSSTPQETTSTSTTAEPTTTQQVDLQPSAGVVGEIEDVEMTSLPGTARGQGGSGDGNADDTMPIYQSLVPYTNFNNKITTYRKVHRLMTFGIAHKFFETLVTQPNETQRYLTTALASIPIHKPYFYLSPAEYNILGRNARVKYIKVSVVHRGNRIAFTTASSETQLATLNNIQNIMVAHGLNKTGYGVDMIPTFSATNPMEPDGASFNEYNQEYINSWYGFPQNATAWNTEVPDVLLGYKSLIRNYFNLVTSGAKSIGHPMLAKDVVFMDGKTTINQLVAEIQYVPKMAPLKRESEFVRYALPDIDGAQTTINVERNVHNVNTITMDNDNSSPDQKFVSGTGTQRPLNNSIFNSDVPNAQGIYNANSFYLANIEKAGFMHKGIWSDAAARQHIQPSLHIGIQPIPALSTPNLAAGASSQFTDCQADWEIVAEMGVEEGLGVDFAWMTEGNKAFSDITMVSTIPANNAVILGGRMPINTIRQV